eukprot:TRINITY_DN14011_c0_g1_i1.p2 TRINITY_DN14011_c0_g1~~TRINITY_DN14011_c0_g1_i1.p2  ORF type:complete len:73 (+),score=7.30 TRINITY_DN14011_c0_g1_i1:62-280(+)
MHGDMNTMRADQDFFAHEFEFVNINKDCVAIFGSVLAGVRETMMIVITVLMNLRISVRFKGGPFVVIHFQIQ